MHLQKKERNHDFHSDPVHYNMMCHHEALEALADSLCLKKPHSMGISVSQFELNKLEGIRDLGFLSSPAPQLLFLDIGYLAQ